MLKSKLLLGLAITVSALATAATPALAEWQSLSTKTPTTTGKITVISGGQWAAIFGGVEANVKCAPGPGTDTNARITGLEWEQIGMKAV